MQASDPENKIYGKAVDLKDEKSISDFFSYVDSIGEKGIDHLSTSYLSLSSPPALTSLP